ncbi:hypothetical protein SFUMM280S_06390 [Streptomyces fumanus]
MSPIAALVLIPALFCVAVGKGAHLGDYVIDGVSSLAPTAAMLMFAIVYFGVMIDVGLFDPVVRAILRFCKADPMRIVVGTALLADRPTLRPRLYWFNALLTVALLAAMIMELLPIPVLFLIGAALALTVNFPHMPDQKARIAAHAENVLNVSGMVFAAAVFTGVLTGTGMVDHMADWLVGAVPEGMGPHMALVTGLLSLPLTYFMSNDGFYFGVLPVLAEAGQAHGVSTLEIARASIVGQPLHMSSPLVPAVYVLVGMAKVEFGDHTRFVVKWAALTCLVVLGAAILFGIV